MQVSGKPTYVRLCLIALFFLVCPDESRVFARPADNPEQTPSDSLAAADSTLPDTIGAEVVRQNKGNQLEAPIYYWAELGMVSKTDNKIYLEGKAKIVYQELTLEAEKIMIDQDNHYLFAEGVVDTVDSLGKPVYTGTPVFKEKGEQPMYGNTLHYDFKTRRGKIGYGKTKMPPGFYRGTDIHKIGQKTLLVEDGYFTSCEYIDNPHFYFRSDKMRVIVKDRIIAKPIYFYIADVPLGVLPFGVFPNKRGRRSGIIVPSYGESGYGGRFLKNIGYYWAPNDYFDATFLTDYYDKLGFTYRANLNYKVRYLLGGSVSGTYFPVDPNTGRRTERWSVNIRHSQEIDPTMRLTAVGRFQSDGNFNRQYSSNINQRLNQVLSSNMTLSKRWKGTKNSMNLNVGRTENLQSGEIDYTFPRLSFTRSRSTFYETFTGKNISGKRKWYQDIYFSYDSKLIRKGAKKKTNDGIFTNSLSQGVNHNLSINAPQKVLKYFNIIPSVNYRETWVDEVTEAELNPETNQIIKTQKKQFAVRRTYNGSVNLKTTIFGMFEPDIGSLKFIRHKMDPQLSFTYTPDFSSPSFGYYTNIIDTTGRKQKIDRFGKNPFSGTPSNESRFLRMSLGNLFQAKIVNGDKEKKIDLFTLKFNTGYDFKADSLKWQNLSTSFRASPFSGTSINITTSHSFYAAGPNGTGRVNRFLLDEGSLPRLLNLNASLTFNLSDKLFETKKGDEEEEEEFETLTQEDIVDIDSNVLQEPEGGGQGRNPAKDLKIPWRVNFRFNYTLDRSNIKNPRETMDLGATAGIQLTRNWRLNWNIRFDPVKKDITYQNFQIYRDLHCWEMSFNWQPTFGYYSFQINVKTPMLRDIKVTKRPSGRAFN